jgi:glycosyltransferase involved in cell wall biosynthesis
MPRLLLLTPAELTRDPRARRAAAAAQARGWEVAGVTGTFPIDDEAVELPGVPVTRLTRGRRTDRLRRTAVGALASSRETGVLARELRGLYQLLRLASQSVLFARAARPLGRFDVVHANDFDTLPAGWAIARRSGARLVYDAHELYTEVEPDPPRVHRAVVGLLERLLARRADAVVTVSDDIADELVARRRLRARPTVVLNCPDRVEVEAPTEHDPPLRAIYQAGAGSGRRLEDLLEAAALAENVHVTLRVTRVDLTDLREEVARRGLADRVDVADPVSPEHLVEQLAAFDVGIVIDRPVALNNALGFPNKLFEYLMAGLAVVVPNLRTMGAFVEREEVGVVFQAGSPQSLARVLNELAADRQQLLSLRRRARAAAVERYNADVQGEALARVWNA